MLRLLVCATYLFALLPVLHAETGPRWLEVKTEHFTVYTDGSDHQARQVSAQLERMHGLFAKLLPHATEDAGSRIFVMALKNRKDFEAVEPAGYQAKGSLELAGYFLPQEDRSYILLRLDTEGEHPYGVVYHEYTHYMMRHIETLPVWLNEGLAQFYQNTDLDEKTARFGQPAANEIRYLREQKLIPLPTLFAVDHNSPFYHEQDKGSVFYAESWALTHMLFFRDFQNHTSRIPEYVTAVSKGDSSVEAAQKAFGDLGQLRKDLDHYVSGGSFSLLSTPLQSTVSETSFTVEPIAAATADAVRADILIANGRKDEGRQMLEQVLRVAPDNAQAHESMGMLALRDGQQREARKWYGEAVALHSTSYLAYFYFGTLSMQFGSGGDNASAAEAAGASLQKAIELNPRFAPALDALAQFDARHEHLEEASQMELRAVGCDPKNVAYRMNAAQIRVQRKEYDTAISILRATLPVAQSPDEKERVQSRLDSMERFVASEKQTQTRSDSQGSPTELADASAGEPGGSAETTSSPSYVTDGHGHRVDGGRAIEAPHLPSGPPSGPHHTVHGTLHQIGCFYPTGLTLQVDGGGKSVALYSNDMYKIAFTTSNFTPQKELNPCTEFDGLKASVVYAEISDGKTAGRSVSGQIVSMELSR